MLFNVVPISEAEKSLHVDLVSSYTVPIPSVKENELQFYQQWLVSMVLQSFANICLPQVIISFNVLHEIFCPMTPPVFKRLVASPNLFYLEVPYQFPLSVTRLPAVLPNIRARRMYSMTANMFPDTTLLYGCKTELTIFYDIQLNLKSRYAQIDFSNLKVNGDLPVYMLTFDFWWKSYPQLMNNFRIMDRQLHRVVNDQ